MKIVTLSLLVFLVSNYGECAKILGVFPMSAHSHYTVGYRLMKELADRGHEVTMISPYPQKTPTKNFRDVSLADTIEPFANKFKGSLLDIDRFYLVATIPYVYSMGYSLTEYSLGHKEVQKLLNSKETFDLVIMEQFLNEPDAYFAHHYKAPLIVLSSIGSSSWTNHYVGNPAPLSHIPNVWATLGANMNLYERFFNAFIAWYDEIYKNLVYFPKQNELLHQYVPNAPHLNDLMNQVSMVLLNSHSSVNEPVPHVPNMIEIGGYHVNPTGKLPQDIQEYLDQATEGVVYFCMGSNLKISEFPKEKQEVFLKTFGKLKQKVLWKFEADMPGKPKNVKLVKWAPQQDILAHPNVKAFISHGGLLSSIEAVYFGVPVIGIPIFGDQKTNIATSVNRGYALSVPFVELTEEKLTDTLTEILTNKKYTENVKEKSVIMKDRVVKPIDEAVYWVEYVLRHPGAPHFRSAAMDLTWIQYNLIDIIALLAIGIVVPLKITKKLASCACRKLRKTKDTKTKKDKKNK